MDIITTHYPRLACYTKKKHNRSTYKVHRPGVYHALSEMLTQIELVDGPQFPAPESFLLRFLGLDAHQQLWQIPQNGHPIGPLLEDEQMTWLYAIGQYPCMLLPLPLAQCIYTCIIDILMLCTSCLQFTPKLVLMETLWLYNYTWLYTPQFYSAISLVSMRYISE